MGEIVEASAHGAASGAVFVTSVSGQPIASVAAVAQVSVNGFAEGVAESSTTEGAALTELLTAVGRAARAQNGVLETAEAFVQMAGTLDLPAGELSSALESYAAGDITEADLADVLTATVAILPGSDNAFRSLLNQLMSPTRNLEVVGNFASQISDILKPIVPQVDLMVAMAIRGAISGAMEGAQNAGLSAGELATVLQSAQDITQTVVSTLTGISLADVLAGVPFNQLLEQSNEGPVLVDLADPLLTAAANLSTEISDPVFFDTDGDGLYDPVEDSLGSDPNDPDTDGDLLKDGAEVHVYNSSPVNNDTDGDGVSDSVEVGLGEDPSVVTVYGIDTDHDGLPDEQEAAVGTSPHLRDTDGDGWWDSFEIGVGSGFLASDANNPLVRNSRIDATPFTVSPVGNEKVQTWLPYFVFTPD